MIGGGVSGLTAGYILSRTDDVTVFEAGCGVRYAGKRGPAGLGAGVPRGGARYLRMLTEVPRFHRAARRLLASGTLDGLSLGEFLRAGGFSGYFTARFAAPLVAAVWSCPPGMALRYPAGYLFAFLANHGMLSVSGAPQWRTVAGGSRGYVERIAERLGKIRLSAPVRSVRRFPDGVQVRDCAGTVLDFDAAVTDTRLLPRSPSVRGLPPGRDYIVTLGGERAVDPARVIATMDYAHPAYTRESVAAQRRLPGLNTPVTAFAGAYHGWGFHEDGCRSGATAARALGGAW